MTSTSTAPRRRRSRCERQGVNVSPDLQCGRHPDDRDHPGGRGDRASPSNSPARGSPTRPGGRRDPDQHLCPRRDDGQPRQSGGRAAGAHRTSPALPRRRVDAVLAGTSNPSGRAGCIISWFVAARAGPLTWVGSSSIWPCGIRSGARSDIRARPRSRCGTGPISRPQRDRFADPHADLATDYRLRATADAAGRLRRHASCSPSMAAPARIHTDGTHVLHGGGPRRPSPPRRRRRRRLAGSARRARHPRDRA